MREAAELVIIEKLLKRSKRGSLWPGGHARSATHAGRYIFLFKDMYGT